MSNLPAETRACSMSKHDPWQYVEWEAEISVVIIIIIIKWLAGSFGQRAHGHYNLHSSNRMHVAGAAQLKLSQAKTSRETHGRREWHDSEKKKDNSLLASGEMKNDGEKSLKKTE